jgi:hypothetical protein
MKDFLNYRISILIIFILFFFNVKSQFAPPAGEQGTTAIHKDSSIFVNWATNCAVELGPEDISNSQSLTVSTGLSNMATGYPGNGVISLGDGGKATITFERTITNGEGWDFAVFENSFSNDFLELAFVEVSSDGENFFRFPTTSFTQDDIQIGAFGSINAEEINNLAGKYSANYGTPFDLSELENIEDLNVNAISHIKIIDVIGSIDDNYCNYDQYANKINDPFPTPFPSSGFDLDAVGVIHQGEVGLAENKTLFKKISLKEDYLVIEIEKPIIDHICLNIFNVNGKAVRNEKIDLSQNTTHYAPTSKLSPGLYILNIVGTQFKRTEKFIIL